MSIIPVFPCDLSRSSRVLNVYLQLRICVRRVSRYIRESPKLLQYIYSSDTVYTPRYLSPLFVNNGVSKMRSRKKKKKQVLSEALLLNFIDIFVVLTVDATVNYQFMTNSSSISFRN